MIGKKMRHVVVKEADAESFPIVLALRAREHLRKANLLLVEAGWPEASEATALALEVMEPKAMAHTTKGATDGVLVTAG